jgi:hypothetical protein
MSVAHKMEIKKSSAMMMMRPTKAPGVIKPRRRHSRTSPAIPDGAEGNGTVADTMIV